MSDRDPGRAATFELNPEEAALVAVQAKLADRPGVLPAARGLSHFGEHSLGWMGLAALGALLSKDRRRQYVTAGVGAFAAHAASVVIKRIVRRRRPDHPAIAVGVGTPSKLSFPSSHATSSTAGAILLGRASGVPGGAVLLPAAVVPPMLTSRMVLGVHYPTDVAAGAAIGAASALAAIEGERLWTRREARRAVKNRTTKHTKGSDN
ncbi:phosphatase PAP2 family protein [Tsukamurella strandjordii]|uniref:Phosphatase PAP2 family protein n=1 Tax=Tsukamurella strandjordii TaxID=147577 RepID=A0AA90NGL7_9ACTN|nr:phosphatase PAP2 family protein [Tsukamurella strandjordii]MDP0400002.1 phosphatase PAP2 family protein [Tsukamurella strandjordii]